MEAVSYGGAGRPNRSAGTTTDLPAGRYQRHLPFWLAVLVAELLVLLIPLLAVLYPMFRFAPIIYDWLERRRVYKFYSELRRIEDEMFSSSPGRTQKELIERLDQLKDRASRLSVPTSFRPHLYALRSYIDMVRQEAQKAIPSQE